MQTSSARPRRILMTVDPIGGVWTYALELARALEPHGIEIALASMGGQLTRGQRDQALARKCEAVESILAEYRVPRLPRGEGQDPCGSVLQSPAPSSR